MLSFLVSVCTLPDSLWLQSDNIGMFMPAHSITLKDVDKVLICAGFEVRDAVALVRLDDLYIECFEVKDVKQVSQTAVCVMPDSAFCLSLTWTC